VEVRVDDLYAIEDRRHQVDAAVNPYGVTAFLENVLALKRRMERLASGDVTGHKLGKGAGLGAVLKDHREALSLMRYQDLSLGRKEGFKIIDWKEMNANLFSALKLQKVVLSLFFLIIIVVAAFNVVGSQVMIVHEKSHEIAILRAMGATRRSVKRIFLFQGVLVAAAGTGAGLLLGAAVCWGLNALEFPLDPKVYLISHLPVRLDPIDLGLTAAATVVITFLATQYSAGKAASRTPTEGLAFYG
jgi:lipoprotein-releasing system permease protein